MEQKSSFLNTLVPKTAVLELTYKCNHACVFCSVPWESPRQDYAKNHELGVLEWKNCIDLLVEQGVRSLAFSGGEPLLNPEFADILRYAGEKSVKEPVFSLSGELSGFRQKAMELSVITNGSLVDLRWVNLFKEVNPIVTVSLPGIKNFKELTGGGSFELALGAIRKLSEAGLSVVVSICVTKKNLPELFETISLGFLNGAKQLLLNRFLPGGRGLNYSELCLDRREITQMLDISEEVCFAAGTFGSVGTELPKCVMHKDYKMLKCGTLCSGGVEFFAIDPSGRVRPCNHSPVTLGDFRDISSALRTDYWQKFKCKDFLPQDCRNCSFSLECDGGCREAAHIVGGEMDSPDPLFIQEAVG